MTTAFVWLHCKQIHLLLFSCISDKVGAQGVFVVLLNHTSYHGTTQLLQNQPGLKSLGLHLFKVAEILWLLKNINCRFVTGNKLWSPP